MVCSGNSFRSFYCQQRFSIGETRELWQENGKVDNVTNECVFSFRKRLSEFADGTKTRGKPSCEPFELFGREGGIKKGRLTFVVTECTARS